MNYDRPLRGVLPDPGSQRVAEDGTIPGVHPLFSYTQPIYEDGILGRTPYQPTTNYPPEYPPQLATSNLSTLLLGNEEGGYVSHAAGGPTPTPLLVIDMSCLRDLRFFASRHP